MPHPASPRLVDPSHHDTPTMLPEVSRLPWEKFTLQGMGWDHPCSGQPSLDQRRRLLTWFYAAAALIVIYAILFFKMTVPWLRHRYGSDLQDLSEFVIFAIWMAAPWLLIQWMRKKELERVLMDHRDLNRPEPFC